MRASGCLLSTTINDTEIQKIKEDFGLAIAEIKIEPPELDNEINQTETELQTEPETIDQLEPELEPELEPGQLEPEPEPTMELRKRKFEHNQNKRSTRHKPNKN